MDRAVKDRDRLIDEGVTVDPKRESYDFGRFGWITGREEIVSSFGSPFQMFAAGRVERWAQRSHRGSLPPEALPFLAIYPMRVGGLAQLAQDFRPGLWKNSTAFLETLHSYR